MASVEQHLSRWLRADLIDRRTADRIRSFEHGARPAGAGPTVLEALVYLAIAAIGAGFLVLIGVNWEDLPSAARIALPGTAAAVLLFAGGIMGERSNSGLRRGARVAWLGAVALAATTGAVTADEAGAAGEWAISIAAAVALPLAIALWIKARTDIQIVGLAGASALLAVAVTAVVAEHRSEDYAPLAFGLALIACSAMGIVAIESGYLVPQLSARAFAGAGLVFGALYSGVSPEPTGTEAIAFVVAGATAITSMSRGVFVYMAVAVLSVFIGLSAVILRHVDDPTAAALAFIASGIAVLAAILILERWRPWQR
jgi:hypothetical protein